MTFAEFWGDTSACVIYDLSVLLRYPHDYSGLDHSSPAYAMLHELFMRCLPFDPFYDESGNEASFPDFAKLLGGDN